MKPIIGILSRPMISKTNRKIYATYHEVSDVVIKYGGIPIQLFPPNIESYHIKSYKKCRHLTKEEKKSLHRAIDLCDGILLQGGSEFYPYDLEVARYTRKKNIPTLGICLGMQTMGYAASGEMGHVEDKKKHQKQNHYAHQISIDPQSKLYQILKKEKLVVNSRHQDCLLHTRLYITAYSDDSVIEAIEDTSKDFYIGVQWHPESMISYDSVMKLLFQSFFDSITEKGDFNIE